MRLVKLPKTMAETLNLLTSELQPANSAEKCIFVLTPLSPLGKVSSVMLVKLAQKVRKTHALVSAHFQSANLARNCTFALIPHSVFTKVR